MGYRPEMSQAKIALGERAIERERLVPEPLGVAGPRGGRVGVGEATTARDPPKLTQNIFPVAAGKAGDENTLVALANGEAGRAVGVGGTRTHRGASVPGSPERAD